MNSSIYKSISSLLLIIIILISPLSASEKTDVQIRVEIPDREKAALLLEQNLDIIGAGENYSEALVSPTQLKELENLGFDFRVVHESLSDFYKNRLQAESGPKTMGGYKTLFEIYAYLDNIVLNYPNIVSSKVHLGLTYEGRDMWAVKISDNPNVDEDEPELLFTAATHSREVITPEVLINAMDHLTSNYGLDPDITSLVDSREIWFVLLVNPDGYYHNEYTDPGGGGLWRKNRRINFDATRGVDLNRNFGYFWGYDDVGSSPTTSSNTYRGTGSFSEPETLNMKNFTEAHNFTIAVYFHSYSNLVLYPWGYDYLYTPDEDIFSQIGDSINNMNGYAPGPGWTLYKVNGSSDDWNYGEQTTKNKIITMTFEVGNSNDGFWPVVSRIPQLVAENLEPILFLSRIAGDIYSLKTPEPPVVTTLPLIEGTDFPIIWTHNDTLNPAVVYEVEELTGRSVIADSAGGLSGWVNSGFSISTSRSNSGPASFYSGSGNSLSNNIQTSFPYLVQSGDSLKFQTYFDIENDWDYAYVEVSTDGKTFNSIPGNVTTTYDPNGNNRGNGITGTVSGWIDAKFNLSTFVGQEIIIRFSYITDGFVVNEGFYADDIYPHLIFETVTTLTSTHTSSVYPVTGKSQGVYYHRVRAKDAQDQWSSFSNIVKTVLIDPNSAGDIDLDGIHATIADLTLFVSYIVKGLTVFNISSDIQIGQTDTDCDGLPLSVADLSLLHEDVLGTNSICYIPPLPSPGDIGISTETFSKNKSSATSSVKALSSGGYSVVIEGDSILSGDSGWANIQLTNANNGLLGFQMQFEYDTAGMHLAYINQGVDIPDWQYFDYFESITGTKALVTIAALAQNGSAPVNPGDINFGSFPANLASLRFSFDATTTIIKDIDFKWSDCSDNTLAYGSLSGSDVFLEGLVVSNLVYNADMVDITGTTPEFGGANQSCSDGLAGVPPATSVDFTSGRMVFEGDCCLGSVGNANGAGGNVPTVGDITAIIEFLFGSGSPLDCYSEADVNLSGAPNATGADISVADITEIIDHLFGIGNPLPDCP